MVNSVGTVRQRLQAILEQDRALAAVEELDALRTSLLAAAKAHVVFDESDVLLSIEHHEGRKVLKLYLPITGVSCEGETLGV